MRIRPELEARFLWQSISALGHRGRERLLTDAAKGGVGCMHAFRSWVGSSLRGPSCTVR